jgi:hypothetical protein
MTYDEDYTKKTLEIVAFMVRFLEGAGYRGEENGI